MAPFQMRFGLRISPSRTYDDEEEEDDQEEEELDECEEEEDMEAESEGTASPPLPPSTMMAQSGRGGGLVAWFRELPAGILDSLTPEQVLHCNTEEECALLASMLPPVEAALLDWAINLMADVVELENYNKMNARNIAMVFAPNMTQMADPLTALMHAVQVMNFLRTLIVKTLKERGEAAAAPKTLQSCSDSSNDQEESQMPEHLEKPFVCSSQESVDHPMIDKAISEQLLLYGAEQALYHNSQNDFEGQEKKCDMEHDKCHSGVSPLGNSSNHRVNSSGKEFGSRNAEGSLLLTTLPPHCCSPLFTALMLLLLFLPSPASAHAFFIFGDSLVDAGNNDYLVTLSKANAPPYGVDFSFSGGKPTGRFTNGRTIADVMGEALGQETFAPPYLAPNSSAEVTSSGVNYASGSSGIFDETGSFYIGRVPLGQQISYFEKTRAQILETMGEKARAEFLEKAMFTVAAGSNDILEFLSPSVPFFGGQKPNPAGFQDALVSKLAFHLKRLNGLGARKFVVADIGPLGCMPYVRALEFIPAGECSAAANKLCEGYNKKLKRMVGRLNQEMGPESVFVYTNTHDIVMEIIQQHRQYGFENALDPCCGGSFPPFLCIGIANASSTLCADRSKYVFWDAFHPTEAVNFIVAGRLVDGGAVDASPVNVRALFQDQHK